MQQTGDADLIDHLGELARAGVAHPNDGFAVALQDRASGLEDRFVAADHDGERAVFGASLPSGSRRVEKADSALVRRFG